MLKLSNIRIGTKLAAMSGLAVLLVTGIIATQMLGDVGVRTATGKATERVLKARDLEAIKASARGMQVAVRDILLGHSVAELKNAEKSLAEQQKAVHDRIDPMIPSVLIPERHALVESIANLVDRYAVEAKAIIEVKSKVVALEAKGTAEATAGATALNADAERIARERGPAIAADAEAAIEKMNVLLTQDAEQGVATAQQEMASSERTGLVVGGMTILILIGSAVYGAMTISKPLRRMAGVLVELTHDRVVDVPCVARGDEIGDIARATEVFKQSIAEKVVNLRVRTALDVVRSSIMLADTDYNILYVNEALQNLMRATESELRKVLPNFDASKLLGGNMDAFHQNPAHQRKMLDSLTGIHEVHITVGSQKFHLVATPVVDKQGQRAGTIVEWRNETLEKAIEAEVDGLVKAAVAGDFSKRVPLEGKKEFMLNLATSMNALCENTGKALQDLIGMLSALANGDLTPRITAEHHGMFGQLKDDANTMAENIGQTIADIKRAAREVSNASAEITTSTTDLSQRTEEQAASLEQTSASMEEISATVKTNAENAQAANHSAADTREVAERGGHVVAKAVEAMARIEESSRKISDIIGVIDEIARQTNLLALNAAVEAARAGEAGRGFAVVASEVRTLAQRSSQAAKDIKDLITNSNGQVKEGVDLVNRAGSSLGEIVGSIKKVADIVADIANASVEQASGVEQVGKALAQMDEVTQQNSALVEENAATAKALEQQAQAMDERVAVFKLAAGAETVQAAATVPQRSTARPAVSDGSASKAPSNATGRAGGPVGRMQTALAAAVSQQPEWKQF